MSLLGELSDVIDAVFERHPDPVVRTIVFGDLLTSVRRERRDPASKLGLRFRLRRNCNMQIMLVIKLGQKYNKVILFDLIRSVSIQKCKLYEYEIFPFNVGDR